MVKTYKSFVMSSVALLLFMTTYILTGCGSMKQNKALPELSGNTYTLQLPVSDTQLLSIEIPEEFPIMMSDNFTYWQLARDVTVYLTDITNHMASDKTDESSLYQNSKTISYDYQDETITIRCESGIQEVFKKYLLSGVVTETDVSLPEIVQLDKYPKGGSVEMMLYDNNLYMPEGAQETKLNIYTASLCTTGKEYLISWICDGKREDVQSRLLNICIANSGNSTLSVWYIDDDLLYAQTGNHVVGMKKLRANEWYIYSGTLPYRDYVLKGLRTVHGGA